MLHRFGTFELDERRFELRRRGKQVGVQRQVLETITYLVKNPDRLISKEELIAGPWRHTCLPVKRMRSSFIRRPNEAL